jgi:membrane protein YdbS with pleckstrin-like domain
MDRFGLLLRNVVFFLFPVPFLLGFAVEQGSNWAAYLAYAAIAVLVVIAALAAITTFTRHRGP